MKNVPKLRFNGFSDDWEEKKLGDFLEFYSTNSLSRDCLNYESGKIRNIHYGDIHMKFPTILDAKKEIIPFINEDIDTSKIKEDSYCKDGDLIIADASEDYNDIGKAIEIENIDNDKVLAGLHTILARDTKGVTAKRFKGYLLLNEAVRKQIKILAAGAKVLGISKTNLVKVAVKLPSKEEQEKIANFLTKVDNIIEKQEEKVSNLVQYKKGMMQRIFSQEIRFKKDEGGEYPEWEKKRLGDYIEERIEKTENKEKYPLYSLTIEDGVVPKSERYERDFLVKNDSNYKIVNRKDFVYNPMNLRFGALAMYSGNMSVCVSGYYNIFYFKNYDISEFWINYLKTDKLFYLYNTIATGSLEEKKRVHYSQFKELILKIPSIEEQIRIGNFLSNIDSIIKKEKEKLEELGIWKKGLLQQMFV